MFLMLIEYIGFGVKQFQLLCLLGPRLYVLYIDLNVHTAIAYLYALYRNICLHCVWGEWGGGSRTLLLPAFWLCVCIVFSPCKKNNIFRLYTWWQSSRYIDIEVTTSAAVLLAPPPTYSPILTWEICRSKHNTASCCLYRYTTSGLGKYIARIENANSSVMNIGMSLCEHKI